VTAKHKGLLQVSILVFGHSRIYLCAHTNRYFLLCSFSFFFVLRNAWTNRDGTPIVVGIPIQLPGRGQRRRTRHGIVPILRHRLTGTRGLRLSRATVAGRILWLRCSHSQGYSAVRSCALRTILVSTLLQECISVPSSLQLTKALCPSWIVSEPLRHKQHGDSEEYAQ
jgi:hypothetical protein